MLLVLSLKTHLQTQSNLDFFSPLFSSKSFIVLHFTFRSVIYFEIIFIKVIWSVFSLNFFFFVIWTSSCSSTVCWKNYPFSIELSLYLCQRS